MASKIVFVGLMLIMLTSSAAPTRKGEAVKPDLDRGVSAERVTLPVAAHSGRMSLEETLVRRRSVREFAAKPLTDQQLAQLLWAIQGVTHPEGLRTAPSAGALYPLEVYVATASGFFRYDPRRHELQRRSDRDFRRDLYRASLEQESVRQAPAVFVLAAVYERTALKYGPVRSPRYVHLEAGHAAQNLLLQAVALGLGGVPIGAFYDAEVQRVCSLPAREQPIYLLPVGQPAAAGQPR